MVSIVRKFATGLTNAVIYSPLSAAFGACCGVVYAKLAQLPIEQAAKAGAIYVVAHSTLMHLTNAMIGHRKVKAFVITVISAVSGAFGVNELKKRGLLNDKTMALFVSVHALSYLSLMAAVAYNRTNKN